MTQKSSPSLLTGPVGSTLLRMTGPMVLGMMAIILFNFVDTIFVGRLGTKHLAAMSFTFPVVFTIQSLALGLSVGTTSVISRAIGAGDHEDVRRLTTHALVLSVSLVTILALTGLFTIDPLFTLLGATPEILPLIRQYMVPWYFGVGFVVVPMVGNGAIRATGDTKTPSYVMMVAGLANVILDPLLIFGIGPFPRMELQGAAIATVIARALTFIAAIWVLRYREKILEFTVHGLAVILDSWKRILHIGIPATAARMLVPLSTGVLTRIIASYGPASVAAFGIGQRVEPLVMIGIASLATAMTPFIGQNYGAGQFDRVREALKFSLKIAVGMGVVSALFLASAARPIVTLFNSDPEVIRTATLFLLIVPISYALFGVAMLIVEAYNAVSKPVRAVVLIVIRLFGFSIPLALIGVSIWGVPGVFVGISAGNILIGIIAFLTSKRFMQNLN